MNRFLCRPLGAVLLTGLLIAADQLTKFLAVLFLKDQEPFVLWDGVFELHYLENRGAAFGMLQGGKAFFVLVGLLVLAMVIYLYRKMPTGVRFLPLRLVSLTILSGAIGNMIDRLRQSYVVDFFYFKLINFPIFNVADIYVTVGVAVLALLIFFYYTDGELECLSFSGRRKEPDT